MESILKKIINQLSNYSGLFIALTFLTIGVLTLPGYGINWDTINHLPRGQAYLNYFLTGHKDYKNLPEWFDYWQDPSTLLITTNVTKIPERSFYQNDLTPFNWYMENDGNGHPPLSDILSAFFNYVLFQKMHFINDIDSYRVYGIFLASILIGVLFIWIKRVYGILAGFFTALSLASYPLFWAEAHFNTEKDIPETVFWSLAIFSTWKAFTGNNWRWLIILGVFLGLALGTKFNILFLPFVLIPWISFYLISHRSITKNLKFRVGIFSIPVIAASIFIGSWPFLWPDPINKIIEVFNFYKVIGTTTTLNTAFIGMFGINTYPLKWIIYTTPIVILIFALIGIFSGIKGLKNEKDKISLLFLLWLLVPIIRVSWPGTTIYGGIRQIMEYIPALAIFSGIGGSIIYRYLKQGISLYLPKRILGVVVFMIMLVAFCPLLYRLMQIHPNENVYFNSLIGGLYGAQEENVPAWGNSFGAAYRQGVKWINKNAELNSKIALGNEMLPNIPGIWFRPDLTVHNTFRSGELKQGEYVISLVYEGTDDIAYFDQYLDKALRPVYQVEVDEVPILKVWKNDLQHTNKQYINKERIIPHQISEDQSAVKIDLGKLVYLAKLEANFDANNCAELKSAQIKTSQNNKDWKTIKGRMPKEDWNVPQLEQQPMGNYFMVPFPAEKAQYIQIIYSPEDACIKNISNLIISVFSDF